MSQHTGEALWRACRRAGIDAAAGVPCSLLGDLIAAAQPDYVPASVEGEAVAMAAGAWLGGGLGCAIMQNSGLGNAINPLASLLLPYRIPALLIVSWRGQAGDAAHHHPMGHATLGLLELFGLPHHVLQADDDLDRRLGELVTQSTRQRTPCALVIPKGALEREPAVAPALEPLGTSASASNVALGASAPTPTSLLEALARIDAEVGEARIVTTTGFTSRTMAACFDRPQHFYMQGSMGFAAAIGLGLARACGERVVVIDGDGALWMRLGTLATIGARRADLTHIVLDNGSYASTGGQIRGTPALDFAAVARACGYAYARRCADLDVLASELRARRRGPVLLHVPVVPEVVAPAPRPSLTPVEIATRCRAQSQPHNSSR